jgi:hypothetical protein
MRSYHRFVVLAGVGILCSLAMPGRPRAQAPNPSDGNIKHCVWLAERLQEAESVKPGMTGADLLKVFTHDGGLQHFQPQRFVLRSCTLIKVDVMFDLPEGAAKTNLRVEELRIKSISKPYLEPMYMD